MVDLNRLCEVLIRIVDVNVLDVEGSPLRVHIETRGDRLCNGCGDGLWVKGRRKVERVDLPVFGDPVRLVWQKYRWRRPL